MAQHLGLRFEAHGYYLPVNASGATICSGGQCIFGFSGSGMFQGDVSAGILIPF